MSVPAFVPLVGETRTHVAVGATTDHLRIPFPEELIWTVLDETLVPWLACTLKDVGLTDSAAAAKAEDGNSNAAKTANNATLADREIMYVLLCAASANRAGLRIYELAEQFSAVRKRTAEFLRYMPPSKGAEGTDDL